MRQTTRKSNKLIKTEKYLKNTIVNGRKSYKDCYINLAHSFNHFCLFNFGDK